ncbi:MAG: PAS domain S-box protein [Nitrospirae bacterium]|nr:PAS domain S-box protein [Nitrospirota bacterium]
MKKSKVLPYANFNRLRRAKNVLKKLKADSESPLKRTDTLSLLIELDNHRTWIEMHKKEFQLASDEVEAVLHWYRDLYDYSPVGYFTLRKDTTILSTNLTGAAMLGAERSQLINNQFGLFVSEDTRHSFNISINDAFEGRTKALCEVKLLNKYSRPFFAHIEATVSEDGQMCHTAVLDITERKQIEQQLLIKNFALESALNAIAFADLNGFLTYVNAAFLWLWGYDSTKDVLGRHATSFWLDEDEAFSALKQATEAGKYLGELIGLKKDGTTFNAYVSANFVKNKSGSPICLMGAFIDITERKKAEEEIRQLNSSLEKRVIERTAELDAAIERLRESENRYKRLLESVTSYVYAVSIRDGRPIDTVYGPGCLAVTGYTFEEYKSNPLLWHSMIYEKDRDAVTGQLNKVFSGEKVADIEHRIIHKDGSVRWIRNTVVPNISDEGHLVSYDGIITDITEQKNAEEELRVSYAYNRSLIEASLDPIVTIGPDGRITDVNTATETMFGHTRHELIGTDFSDYFTGPDKARAVYLKTFHEGQIHDHQLELKHRDGSVTSVLYNATGYVDREGRIMGVFAAARDITERRRLEREISEIRTGTGAS